MEIQPKKKLWNFVNPLNKGPSPRIFFSSIAESDVLIVWGGEDKDGLNNDMNVYNIIFNTWSTIVPSNYVIPSKRKAACMAFNYPSAYIYGGIDANGAQKNLWEFNFGNNTYTLISECVSISHTYCTADNEKFKVLGGIKSDGIQSELELTYIFSSKAWEFSLFTVYSSSNGIYFKMDDFEFIIGGYFGFKRLNNEFDFLNSSNILKYEIDVLFYLPGYTYYNTSIYYFGGGYYLSEYLLFSNLPKPDIRKFELISICGFLGCHVQCSKEITLLVNLISSVLLKYYLSSFAVTEDFNHDYEFYLLD